MAGHAWPTAYFLIPSTALHLTALVKQSRASSLIPSSLLLLELLRPGPADFVFAAISVPTPGDPSQT